MANLAEYCNLHKVSAAIVEHHPIRVVISKTSLREALKEGLDETPVKPTPLQFQAKYLNADVQLVMANAFSKNSDWWAFFREEHREQAMMFKMSYG